MTATTATDLRMVEPLDRRAAVELGRVEYRRFVDALAALDADDWSRPTDCEGWTVRDLAGHLGGAMVTATSLRRLVALQWAVARRRKRTGERTVDAMTALEIAQVADLPAGELVARMGALVDAAADGRRRPPAWLCGLARFPVETGSVSETWTLDYLLGVILTRDTWLHRVADLARAVGRAPVVSADHDGRIVVDIAAEWARRHGAPVRLVLTGPAGGRYESGAGGPALELDAIEFCRTVSGRTEPTHPLLATEVPF